MVGFRFRINDLPEEPDEPRILITKIFLPVGLLFLAFGGWASWKYFQWHAPPDKMLHEIRLQEVRKLTGGHDPAREVQTIHLLSRQGSVEYKSPWPRYEEVRQLNTNLSLLVDSTNVVWALKSADGTISEREFFVSRNLEVKTLTGFCAIVFVPCGLYIWFAFGLRNVRCGKGRSRTACKFCCQPENWSWSRRCLAICSSTAWCWFRCSGKSCRVGCSGCFGF
jgi:hypothetical protein